MKDKNKMVLGDWCKWFEKNFSPEVMIPELPIIIRLDGNNFHQWTKGLNSPFDVRLSDLMVETTKYLVEETNAVVGYTQSDEITLVLYNSDNKILSYNDGKKQKILSKLSAKCVNFFNKKRLELLPDHNKVAVFDCRVYQVPTLEWACKQIWWRELDATKNSIYMLARSIFPHKSLQNLDGNKLQQKMFTEKGVNWNDLEARFKRGTYVMRKKITKKFTAEEIDTLPPLHNSRKNPDLEFTRHVIEVCNMPVFGLIKNKVDVIFNSADIILKSDIKI